MSRVAAPFVNIGLHQYEMDLRPTGIGQRFGVVGSLDHIVAFQCSGVSGDEAGIGPPRF